MVWWVPCTQYGLELIKEDWSPSYLPSFFLYNKNSGLMYVLHHLCLIASGLP